MDWTFSPITWLILLAFATFRLGWLFARDAGPFALLDKWRDLLAGRAADSGHQGWAWSFHELFDCPLCLGMWLSALLLFLALLPVIAIKLIVLWLAVAGLQSFLSLLIIKDE